jgi:signal transduction histidine kinase
MDQAIKEANRKLNIYTSIARHDIQNKITVLLAYLGRTKKAVTDPVLLDYLSHQEEAAKAIRTEINLTRDFKDMGLKSPEWQNVPQIFEGVISRYEQKPLTIITDIPEVEIYADGQLEHIFDRLLDKFVERHEDTPEIRISHRINDSLLTIIIEDNGLGFSQYEKDRLFELQSDGSGDRDLFMAHEILSLTNISLVETGDPGKGARFEIRIPETYYRFF